MIFLYTDLPEGFTLDHQLSMMYHIEVCIFLLSNFFFFSENIPGSSDLLQTEIGLKIVPLSSTSFVQDEDPDILGCTSLPSTSSTEPNNDVSMNWETFLNISCDDEANIEITPGVSDTERNAEGMFF